MKTLTPNYFITKVLTLDGKEVPAVGDDNGTTIVVYRDIDALVFAHKLQDMLNNMLDGSL